MLLTLNHHYPSPPPPPKPLTSATLHRHHLHLHRHHHNPLPLYPIPKTLILNHPQNAPKPLTRSSNSNHSSPQTTLPRTAIQRIAEKLRSLGFTTQETHKSPKLDPNTTLDGQKPGEIFIPLPNQLSKYRVGHTLDPSWSTPENPVPRPGSGNAIATFRELRKVVKRERFARKGEGKAPTLAELSLSKEELRRLTTLGIKESRKLKVGKAGVTEGIVNGIHERWRRAEVVKIVCEDLCRENMKRTHDLLERKTGGLVVWRSGSKIILYRGASYKYPYFLSENNSVNETYDDAAVDTAVYSGETDKLESCTSGMDNLKPVGQSPTNKVARPALIQGVGSPNRVRFQLPGEAQLSEEGDRLLDGLGPRFTDWWGCEPLPIDADLLPAVVSGFRKTFRLLPYGVKLSLTNDEMTTLRRLSRSLPCHFALGRNRKLQGLAAAIVKLWEKCEVAKIAVKRGVQNTNSELMAEELKWLTGGTIISRDREFIVLYRGKDFLPAAVSSAIEERRKRVIHGGKHWIEHSSAVVTSKELVDGTADCNSEDRHKGGNNCSGDLSKEKKLRHTDAALKNTQIKLSMALEKKAKAEKFLEELEKAETPQQPEIDKEGITEEERYMLRKVGLKMKPFLLMGRRGVFDGTIENMHLHWKYRELVKLICKERSYGAVREAAETLEAESGGILVAVERVSKGHAIIVYRGKNYTRPVSLRPQTLLNKREAMKRSKEAQRRESLKLHVLRLTSTIDDLKLQLDKDKEAQNIQSFDGSSFEVKEKENKESGTCAEADSELNLDPHNYSASSDYNEENVESEERNFSPLESGELLDSVNETMGSIVHSDKNELEESSSVVVNKKDEKPSRVILSNRGRLLLRRQALKMKKRPVLAVGRSNIVTGVAKAIKDHLKRYPLAVVNVKGRAKGTSVQEVVFQLEQATGAVLVSQEPSKVILYRGWGADEEGPGRKGKKNGRDARETSGGREPEAPHTVSPELIEAIRFECGLQGDQEKQANALFIHQKP